MLRNLKRKRLAERRKPPSAFAVAQELGVVGVDNDPRTDVACQHSRYLRAVLRDTSFLISGHRSRCLGLTIDATRGLIRGLISIVRVGTLQGAKSKTIELTCSSNNCRLPLNGSATHLRYL